jgi:uncharacterized protein (TIGR03437 family)
MALGQHTGTVNIIAGASTHTISLLLNVMAELPTVTAVYNAASLQQGAIAPGEIITLSGSSLGPDTPVKMTVTNNQVNTTLSGTRVLVGGMPAPLLYADATQVTAVVPYAMAGRSSALIQVEHEEQKSNGVTVDVAVTAPGIFTLNGSGIGPGAVLNEDGSVNSSHNPAAEGTVIMVFATGEGQTLPFGQDGQMAGDLTALPQPVLPVTATIQGTPATVLYAGAAPNAVAGMLQVNILVPQGSGSGDIVLTIGAKSSQLGVTVAVK